MQRTFVAKNEEMGKSWNRDWYVVNADGKRLGRMATEIAVILQGKHKPIYTPHVDTGDYVIVINAEKIAVTGRKEDEKIYYRHSGYPGGLRASSLRQLRERYPDRVIKNAVRGMLPKNRLGRQIIGKLKVYAGPEHPHAAQNPQPLDIRKVGA